MQDLFITYFEFACETYVLKDDSFETYRDLMIKELHKMSKEDLVNLLNTMNEKLNSLNQNKELALIYNEKKDNIPNELKKVYTDTMEHFPIKSHFYKETIQSINNLIKDKETEISR